MTKPTKSFSVSQRDRLVLRKMMYWHLGRRRQMVPWPLDPETTQLLWWPPDKWNTLRKMGADGFEPDNHSGSIRLEIPGRKSISLLRTIRPELLFPNTSCYAYPRTVKLLPDSPGYEAYTKWADGAFKIDLVNREIMSAWDEVVGVATSWLQIFKAFPESMKILVGAIDGYLASVNTNWYEKKHSLTVTSKMREVWAIVQTLDPERSRAHSLPADIIETLKTVRPLAAVTCAHAALLKAEMSGLLDDSQLGKTWISHT